MNEPAITHTGNRITTSYIGTITKNNPRGIVILKRLRAALKGTNFRLALHGRGSREPMKALGYDAHARQSDLPLYLAEKIDIYIRQKSGDQVFGWEDQREKEKDWAKKLRRIASQP